MIRTVSPYRYMPLFASGPVKKPIAETPEYLNLSFQEESAAKLAEMMFKVVIDRKLIDPEKVESVCDFGAGTGAPTLV